MTQISSTKEIPLTKGFVTIVDDGDYEFLSQWKWHCNNSCRPYAVRKQSGKRILMHRVLAKTPEGMDTDHINGNTLDNRNSNLRICTHQENTRNKGGKKKGSSSKYKGVNWNKREKKWRVLISPGLFLNEDDAARAYNEAAIKIFGEFTRLNVIS